MLTRRKILGFSSLIAAVGLGLVATPEAADAQRGRILERFLILPPHPADHADSAYILELTDEVRLRLEGRFRTQVAIITTEMYCEALEASGFDCTFLPDDNSALQLANFLKADSYTTAEFSRNSQPRLRMRLVDIGRSGIAGWITVVGVAGQEADDFAKAVADSIREQVRAAEDARECLERRDRGDYDDARKRAEDVFEDYPNHPVAAQCVADVFAATNQPPDSMIWAYQKAVAGDPLLERAWLRLAENHFAKGDTVGAIEASERRLEAVPDDVELRLSVIQMWRLHEEPERAIPLVEDGLERYPQHLDLMQLRARVCFDSQNWACAVDAFRNWYEMQPDIGDSLFFVQVLGAAEFADDSAAMLEWTERAVQEFPNSVSFWGRRASALAGTDDLEGTVEAYGKVMELNPNEPRAKLAYASKLVETVVIDTMVALDTATLMEADSLMSIVAAELGTDPNIRRSLAVFYYTPGEALARAPLRPDIALAWLDKAIQYDASGQITVPASFFYAVAARMHLASWYQEVAASESCEQAQAFDTIAKAAVERLAAGERIAPQYAASLRPGLEQISAAGTSVVDAYCSSR